MADEKKEEVATETPAAPPPESEAPKADPEKTTVAPPPAEEKPEESKALAVVEKVPEPKPKKTSSGSHDRDVALAEVEKEKRLSFIRAWEDSEKSKAENKHVPKPSLAYYISILHINIYIHIMQLINVSSLLKLVSRAQKKLSAIVAWENSRKAALEANLRKIEEQLEKKKAEYVEKMKNNVALLHKEAEEKRAMVEAKRGEELLKAEEMAAKCRATGKTPKKAIGCF